MKQQRELVEVMDMAMQRAVARLAELAAREQQLRQEIAALDEQRNSTLSMPHEARAIGADMAWAGLIGKRMAEKNQQLLIVLAEKAQHQARARRAFGRHMAATALADQAESATRSKAEKDKLALLQELFLTGG